MTIQPIGAASVALYLTPDDLREHGLTPEDLTEELALRLTREAFSQAGISVEGTLEIEAYPELCGVLVFARFQPPRRLWFTFRSLEEVLAAARALGNPAPEGDLVWCDGVYWLSLPADAERAACLRQHAPHRRSACRPATLFSRENGIKPEKLGKFPPEIFPAENAVTFV